MVTDSAVGAQEENNLRHLVNNLGPDVPRSRVVPFLTTKHSVEFCLAYADQVVQHDFPALVVLGGDKHVGRARAVEHAWQLRRLIRQRHPEPAPGGMGQPGGRSGRARWRSSAGTSSRPTSISARSSRTIAWARWSTFLEAAGRAGVTLPGVFGVFYYRSAKPATLDVLSRFLPVPAEALKAEFAAGATPVDVCARTIRELRALGVRHFYVSNLPLTRTAAVLRAILDRAGVMTGAA